jgi:hypothetical protein
MTQPPARRRLLAVLLAVLLASAFTPAAVEAARVRKNPAAAKPAAKGATPTADEQTKVTVERGAGGKKVYKIEGEIVIEGKIQKPEAFYVLQKSSINYDWNELKQEFVPKVLESVSKSPF